MSVCSSVLYMYVCLSKCLSVHMYTCQLVVCQYVHVHMSVCLLSFHWFVCHRRIWFVSLSTLNEHNCALFVSLYLNIV